MQNKKTKNSGYEKKKESGLGAFSRNRQKALCRKARTRFPFLSFGPFACSLAHSPSISIGARYVLRGPRSGPCGRCGGLAPPPELSIAMRRRWRSGRRRRRRRWPLPRLLRRPFSLGGDDPSPPSRRRRLLPPLAGCPPRRDVRLFSLSRPRSRASRAGTANAGGGGGKRQQHAAAQEAAVTPLFCVFFPRCGLLRPRARRRRGSRQGRRLRPRRVLRPLPGQGRRGGGSSAPPRRGRGGTRRRKSGSLLSSSALSSAAARSSGSRRRRGGAAPDVRARRRGRGPSGDLLRRRGPRRPARPQGLAAELRRRRKGGGAGAAAGGGGCGRRRRRRCCRPSSCRFHAASFGRGRRGRCRRRDPCRRRRRGREPLFWSRWSFFFDFQVLFPPCGPEAACRRRRRRRRRPRRGSGAARSSFFVFFFFLFSFLSSSFPSLSLLPLWPARRLADARASRGPFPCPDSLGGQRASSSRGRRRRDGGARERKVDSPASCDLLLPFPSGRPRALSVGPLGALARLEGRGGGLRAPGV